MKHINYIINGVLAIAIAILFFLHFYSKSADNNGDEPQKSSIHISSGSGIVYLNVDSVLQEYDMYYEFKNAFEAKQKKLENELNTKTRTWERDAADFQDKVQKGLLLRSQAQEMQQKLSIEQQNLLQLRDEMTLELAEEEQVMNRQLIYSIMEYLKEYNTDHNYRFILGTSFGGNILYANDSLDITTEIIKGLNQKYIEGKEAENQED